MLYLQIFCSIQTGKIIARDLRGDDLESKLAEVLGK